MDEKELGIWLWPRLKDRLQPPEDWPKKSGWLWILDGERVTAGGLWMKAVMPILEREGVQISFPRNQGNMQRVASQMRLEYIEGLGNVAIRS